MSSLLVQSIAREKRTWKCRSKTLVSGGMRGESWYWRCNDLRSESMAEKNADREDFRGANHLRVNNGRNRSVQPWLRLLTGITVMVKQASNGKNRQKLQRTHKMRVSFIDFTCKCSYFKIFIVVNRPYFVPYTIPYNLFQFSTVPLEPLTPSHTTRDASMNKLLAFSRDVSLGRLWCHPPGVKYGFIKGKQ